MRVVYDTRTVPALDRYDYYRSAAGNEVGPVEVSGRRTTELIVVRQVAHVSEFEIGTFAWACEGQIVAHRTPRCIRAVDPECYRLLMCLDGGRRIEQVGNQVVYRPRDIGLYDLSLPFVDWHPVGEHASRQTMVTFPRTVLPVPEKAVRAVVGTLFPRRQPGRGLLAQVLVDLFNGELPETDEPAFAEALRECVLALIRARLGLPAGLSPRVQRMAHLVRIRSAVRRRLADPKLDPAGIAATAGISLRYLQKLLSAEGTTAMRMVKELRLAEALRHLELSTSPDRPIRDIAAACGYARSDQFAHDIRQAFGVSARELRHRARSGQA